jgi:hypothetical protein
MKLFIAAACLLYTSIAAAQRKPGNPLEHLPAGIEILTHFGERADISPDNRRIAFMNKSFGDAFTVDLQTRVIRCLTCNVPGAAFLRVMHLVTGDYILIGPDHFENIQISRTRDNELWFLSKAPGSKPVKMGQRMSEGIAISKKSMLVSFSVLPPQESFAGRGLAIGSRRSQHYGRRGQAHQQESGPSEQGRQLPAGSAGLLRQRHEDDVHLL